MFPHADRIAKLLQEGKKEEARALHNQYIGQQFERAKHEPINLSDLLAAKEAFVVDEIDRHGAVEYTHPEHISQYENPKPKGHE